VKQLRLARYLAASSLGLLCTSEKVVARPRSVTTEKPRNIPARRVPSAGGEDEIRSSGKIIFGAAETDNPCHAPDGAPSAPAQCLCFLLLASFAVWPLPTPFSGPLYRCHFRFLYHLS
jgi:hypothetical protein